MIFQNLDLDGNGTLAASKILARFDSPAFAYPPEKQESVRRCVLAADKDSNGLITLRDFLTEIRLERAAVQGAIAQAAHQPFYPLGAKIDEVTHLHTRFTDTPFETKQFRHYEQSNYKLLMDSLHQEAHSEDPPQGSTRRAEAIFNLWCTLYDNAHNKSIEYWRQQGFDDEQINEWKRPDGQEYWSSSWRVRRAYDNKDDAELAAVLWGRNEAYSRLNDAILRDDPDELRKFDALCYSLTRYIKAEPSPKRVVLHRQTKIQDRQVGQVDPTAEPPCFRQPLFVAAMETDNGETLSEDEKRTLLGFGDGPILRFVVEAGCSNCRRLEARLCEFPQEKEWLIPAYAPVRFIGQKLVKDFLGRGRDRYIVTLQVVDDSEVGARSLSSFLAMAVQDQDGNMVESFDFDQLPSSLPQSPSLLKTALATSVPAISAVGMALANAAPAMVASAPGSSASQPQRPMAFTLFMVAAAAFIVVLFITLIVRTWRNRRGSHF